jgi:hypothetical protein
LACRIFLIILLSCAVRAQQPAVRQDARNTYAIQGVLVDAVTLQPITKARVAIAPVTKGDDFTWALTGDDGHFRFSNLAANKYTLSAQRSGYVTQALDQHDGFASSVAVGPNTDSEHILFRLPPECKISGTVVDEAGEPVRDAQIMLFRTGVSGGTDATRESRQSTTDDQGLYHFGHLSPGRYLIAVSARVWYAQRPQSRPDIIRTTITGGSNGSYESSSGGFSGRPPELPNDNNVTSPLDVVYPITFFAGTTDPENASAITLKQGDKVVADLNLQPVAALHLRLPGADAAAQSGLLTLQRKLFNGVSVPITTEARINAAGGVELVGVPPGHYTVKTTDASHPQQEESTAELDAVTSGPVQEYAVSGAQVSVAIKLGPGTTRPTQSYLQLLNLKTRDYFNQQITAEGNIEFQKPVPPGAYELSLVNSRGNFIHSISAAGARALGRTIDIRGTRAVKLTISVGLGMGQVSGIALRGGKPVSGVMVVLVPDDPANNGILIRRDQSDTDGTFTLPGAVPGKYTVLAIENGWELEWLKPQVLAPYLAGGTPIEVSPNGKYDVKVNVQ